MASRAPRVVRNPQRPLNPSLREPLFMPQSRPSGKHREPAGSAGKPPFLPNSAPGEAPFYSVDSMTARGAPGLMRERHWRMMGALEARDGMLLFGVGTAYVFAVMQAYWVLMIRLH